jgi:hypothetical protein
LSERADAGIVAQRDLVTAAALLDLVSAPWLGELAHRCRENGAAVLFPMIYDGRIHCTPAEPGDEAVRDRVNQHQHTDKGFGPALGPDAAGTAGRLFASLGYEVRRGSSDWHVGPNAGALQEQLIDGWATAATTIDPASSALIADWRTRRLTHVAAGRSILTVGHQDIAGWLPQAGG